MTDAPERIWASKSTKGQCVVSFSTPSEEYCTEYIRRDAVRDLPEVKALVEAAGELTSIVEGIQGAFNHGNWRDEKNGMRLKDTTEWCALYCALAAMKAKK